VTRAVAEGSGVGSCIYRSRKRHKERREKKIEPGVKEEDQDYKSQDIQDTDEKKKCILSQDFQAFKKKTNGMKMHILET